MIGFTAEEVTGNYNKISFTTTDVLSGMFLRCKQAFFSRNSVAVLYYFQCYGVIGTVQISSEISFNLLCDLSMNNYGYYIIGAALWYGVFLWICRHIWFSEIERMAKLEKYDHC
jgi:hypothetical protein